MPKVLSDRTAARLLSVLNGADLGRGRGVTAGTSRWAVVRCLSATAVGGNDALDHCYPAVVLQPTTTLTAEPDLVALCLLTLLGPDGSFVTPTEGQPYAALLTGEVESDRSTSGDDHLRGRNRAFAVTPDLAAGGQSGSCVGWEWVAGLRRRDRLRVLIDGVATDLRLSSTDGLAWGGSASEVTICGYVFSVSFERGDHNGPKLSLTYLRFSDESGSGSGSGAGSGSGSGSGTGEDVPEGTYVGVRGCAGCSYGTFGFAKCDICRSDPPTAGGCDGIVRVRVELETAETFAIAGDCGLPAFESPAVLGLTFAGDLAWLGTVPVYALPLGTLSVAGTSLAEWRSEVNLPSFDEDTSCDNPHRVWRIDAFLVCVEGEVRFGVSVYYLSDIGVVQSIPWLGLGKALTEGEVLPAFAPTAVPITGVDVHLSSVCPVYEVGSGATVSAAAGSAAGCDEARRPCTIPNWFGPGWYCIWDEELGRCRPEELLEVDECNTNVAICSGAPYVDEAAALAACGEGSGSGSGEGSGVGSGSGSGGSGGSGGGGAGMRACCPEYDADVTSVAMAVLSDSCGGFASAAMSYTPYAVGGEAAALDVNGQDWDVRLFCGADGIWLALLQNPNGGSYTGTLEPGGLQSCGPAGIVRTYRFTIPPGAGSFPYTGGCVLVVQFTAV